MPVRAVFFSLFLACLGILGSTLAWSQNAFHRLTSEVKLKIESPDWDYLALDPVRSWLFIGARGDGALVFDLSTQKLVKKIQYSEGANAITLVQEFDRAYTTNSDGTSTVFRLSNLEFLEKIKLGDDADAGYYDPATKQVIFMRSDSREMTFVAADTGKIRSRMKTNSKKLEATVADGSGHIFTALRDRNSVIKVGMLDYKVISEWPVPGCDGANGLAFDRLNHRLFIGCRGAQAALVVLNALTGELISKMEIGRGNDGVIFDPETHLIYASGGVDANLVIYRQKTADHYELVEATTTRPNARTMVLHPVTKRIHMVTAEGTVDPSLPVNRSVSPFYPNRYLTNSLTVLTYSNH